MLAPVKAVSPFDTAGVGGGGGTDLRIVELLRIVENEAGRVGCFVVMCRSKLGGAVGARECGIIKGQGARSRTASPTCWRRPW